MKFSIAGYSTNKSGVAFSANSTGGLYFPSFFYIHIETFVDFFNREVTPIRGTKSYEDMSTFSHEYIHFMQDISTAYGLTNIYNIYGRIGNYLSAVYQSKVESIKFPVSLDNIEGSFLMNLVMENTLGTDMGISWTCEELFQNIEVLSIISEEYEFFEIPERKNFNNPANQSVRLQLRLTRIDGKTEYKDFLFGACAIRESMANLVEHHLFPNDKKGMVVQYDIVEIICKKFNIEGVNEAFMVSLCDYSLMTSNPGYFFMIILNAMKEKKYTHNNLDEVYLFFNACVKQKYDHTYEAARKRIEDMFPEKGDLLKKPGKFLLSVLDKSFKFRAENPCYWGKLIESDRATALARFNELANTFGCTLIIDDFNNYYSTCSTDNDLLMFPTYFAVYSLFNNAGNFKCQNEIICNMLCPDKMDANCENSPWIKSTMTDTENVCAFAALWNYWKLNGKGLHI